MRIVVLRSNPIAPDPRVEKILIALESAGYSTLAVGWDRSGELPVDDQLSGAALMRLSIPAHYGSGLQNFPNLLRWQIGLTRWLIKNHDQFDLIHACDFDTILPALYCKARWKVKVIYDIFDFYADHLRRTPGWIKKMIRRLDYWAIHQADAVVLVDDSRKDQIRGSKPKRLEIIYNSPIDKPVNHQILPPRKHDTKLCLAYIGLLQRERGLFEMIDVLSHHPEWQLDLAGFGGDEAEIVAHIKDLPNINWLGRIDYEHTLAISKNADVLFATYDPEIPNHRYSSPNKVFEAMMLGKPIIVARGTNMDRIIERMDCGLVMNYGSIEDLENSLTYLCENPHERDRLGRNARKAYDDVYGWSIMEKRLLDLYQLIDGQFQSTLSALQ